MGELRDLYQEMILDHGKKPRNFGRVETPSHQSEGYNPLCGDKLYLTLSVSDGTIDDVRFEGEGCAISTASASLMTSTLKGKTPGQAHALFGEVHRLLTDDEAAPDPDTLGKLAVFSGVREFPTRVKCATLCWHTLEAALEEKDEPVTTE